MIMIFLIPKEVTSLVAEIVRILCMKHNLKKSSKILTFRRFSFHNIRGFVKLKENKISFMKFILILTAVLLIISSCSLDDNNCGCTAEFAMINVVVVDEQNSPIAGLISEVKSEFGKSYDLSDAEVPFQGNYTVMTDKYVDDFTILPKAVHFTGRLGSFEVKADFRINTDECKCHINKVSGPDTLVLK